VSPVCGPQYEGRKRKETIEFFPSSPFPSITPSKLQVSDSIRGSSANILEAKNAFSGYVYKLTQRHNPGHHHQYSYAHRRENLDSKVSVNVGIVNKQWCC
jgi:hypothetical protein